MRSRVRIQSEEEDEVYLEYEMWTDVLAEMETSYRNRLLEK